MSKPSVTQTENSVPTQLQALVQEAVAAHQRGDFAAAEAGYRAALRQSPAHADATHFLGLLAHQTGHADAALGMLRHAIKLGPTSYLYRHNLGGVFRALGRHVEAERCYREALALKPDYVDARIGLAQVYMAQSRFAEALAGYAQALALEPCRFEALMGRGAALAELVRRSEALACYQEARALAARDADKLQSVGLAFHRLDAPEVARACLEDALAVRPDFAEAHNSLGIILGDLGDLRGAEACYREALHIKPDHVGAYYNLISLIRLKPGDPFWRPLMELTENLELKPANEAILLHFALGKLWEDAGEYERAFRHFLEGNRLKRAGSNYDEARQVAFYHNYIRYFDSVFMNSHSGAGTDDELPVFIVGMSRSGTTLVEQILASHPLVHGAGELHLLRQCLYLELGSVASDDELPQRLVCLDDKGMNRIGARYSAAARELAPAAARVTDKLPGNMALVGLIHLIFPRARIIHCVREPLDTCVSCFSKHFTTGHDFSYELGELGRFYRLYEELMQHWRTVLPPGRMLEVRYEDMVADMEAQARRLLAYCGLPWNDACLRFYESARPVRTASLAQVRRPIYASSVGRWKRYESYLLPLRQVLAGK